MLAKFSDRQFRRSLFGLLQWYVITETKLVYGNVFIDGFQINQVEINSIHRIIQCWRILKRTSIKIYAVIRNI